MAGPKDLVIEQGATFRLPLTYKIDGELVDLTGYQAQMQIRSSVVAGGVILELFDGAGITLGDAAGTIEVLVSDEDTAVLDFANPAYYDLLLESGGGEVRRLLEGRVTLSRGGAMEDES